MRLVVYRHGKGVGGKDVLNEKVFTKRSACLYAEARGGARHYVCHFSTHARTLPLRVHSPDAQRFPTRFLHEH